MNMGHEGCPIQIIEMNEWLHISVCRCVWEGGKWGFHDQQTRIHEIIIIIIGKF